MDESYLEWLRFLPGFTPAKARKVAERFPTLERLRAATPEELASVEGLASADAEVLHRHARNPTARGGSGRLFLCPECGSFAGPSAENCPFCGVPFAGSQEMPLVEGLDEFLREEESPAVLCSRCGAAMERGAIRCPICGREYTPKELSILPGMHAELEDTSHSCPHCGAYLSVHATECAICGLDQLRVPLVNGHNGKGLSHGFLSRWQRVAEAAPQTETERLREELEHYERLLETNPALERAWAKRGRLLAKMGRAIEAAESLAKAAELDSTRDEDYRLEVLDILRAKGDLSFLPAHWRQPAATSAPRAVDSRLTEALHHYESLLRADPTTVVAWRTKGEILERLGRTAEAREALDRATWLESHEGQSLKASVSGLQTMSPRASLSTARTSGFRNGHTNGHTNGRTNGRTNGLAEGRVNGLTNGAVNGLGLTQGVTNGLGSLRVGAGRTNGLVNGNGFTNGRRGRFAPRPIRTQPNWARSLVGIAAVVALMILVPILASLMSPTATSPSAIQIDHDFGDWSRLSAYANAPPPNLNNPDINLLEVKVTTDPYNLYVYARLQGTIFQAPWTNGTESVLVFVDTDRKPSTGYPVGNLGADLLAEVSGWDGLVQTQSRFVFNETGALQSHDFRRFLGQGSVSAASVGSQIEMRIPLDTNPALAHVLVYAADNRGNRDSMLGLIQPSRPTVVVAQRTVAPAVVTNLTTAILRVDLTPMGGTPTVSGLNLTREGTSTDSVTISAYQDEGNRDFGVGDSLLAQAPLVGPSVRLSMNVSLRAPATLWIVAAWANVTPFTTFGLLVTDITGNGTASLRPPETTLDYLARAPTSPVVDGAFGDWSGRTYGVDVLGDVVNRSGYMMYNANVDLLATAVDLGANLTGYAQVDGRMLGGEDIPTDVIRPYSSSGGNNTNLTVPYVPQVGVDILYAYVDADNSTATGLHATVENRTYGFDHVLAVIGRNSVVTSSALYDYAPQNTTRWQFAALVSAAVDAHRIEFAVNTSLMNFTADFRVVYYATDWRFQYDVALPDAMLRTFSLASLVIATHVVINEVSPNPNPEWVEVANPTAASVNIGGWTLAVIRGGRTYTIYRFPTGTILGAFGSGSEYLVAVPPRGSLPNGVGRVVLRQGVVRIDSTTYSSAAGGSQTWSRFKDATTGQPSDSDNDAVDFYLSTVPTRGGPNDRTRPIITIGKTVSAARATPGDVLTYTLYYNNTGDGGARTVWINDTLPIGVTYQSASRAPSMIVGSTYGWVLTNVTPGGHSLTISAQVNGNGTDGSLQVNRATLAYTDQLRRMMTGSQAWANFTVTRPVITIAKTVSPSTAVAGQTVTYRIYYNNTGSANAGTVSIADVLPGGLVYQGANPAPTAVSGRKYYWNFTNVAPGAHSITMTATVSATAQGPQLVNWAFLNYTSTRGYALKGSQASAVLTIPELSDFLFVVAVPALILCLRIRARRKTCAGPDAGPRGE